MKKISRKQGSRQHKLFIFIKGTGQSEFQDCCKNIGKTRRNRRKTDKMVNNRELAQTIFNLFFLSKNVISWWSLYLWIDLLISEKESFRILQNPLDYPLSWVPFSFSSVDSIFSNRHNNPRQIPYFSFY